MSVKGAVFFKVFRLYRSLVTYKSCDSDVSRSFPFLRPTCSPFVCFLYFSSPPPLSLSLLPSPFPQRFHRLVARVAAELHPRRRVVSEGGGSFSLLSAGEKNRDRGRGRRRSALSPFRAVASRERPITTATIVLVITIVVIIDRRIPLVEVIWHALQRALLRARRGRGGGRGLESVI